jgi:hypothetical protein
MVSLPGKLHNGSVFGRKKRTGFQIKESKKTARPLASVLARSYC